MCVCVCVCACVCVCVIFTNRYKIESYLKLFCKSFVLRIITCVKKVSSRLQ